MQTTIGTFLLRRLTEIGVGHLLGVPGDYNLQMLEQVKEVDGLEFIGTCNELNAAYAADGYARLRGCAAVLTTYGVGDLSAICAVAGAAAEHVPVVCITGAPPLYAMQQSMLLHHTLANGNYNDVMTCFAQFTAAQTLLTPANAVTEIDRVLLTCLREKRPVYIQIPSNISYLTVEAPDTPLVVAFASDPERLASAADHLAARLTQAERPALLLDMDADRFGLAGPLRRLVDKMQMPYAALTTGKGILDETDPLSVGFYVGKGSSPKARACIEQSDCLIATAPRFIEGNSGGFTHALPASTVTLGGRGTQIDGIYYEGVSGEDLIERVTQLVEAKTPAPAEMAAPDEWQVQPDAPLTQARLWPRMARFVQPGDVVVAENGTSSIGITPQVLPAGVTYVAGNIWGSIGYTLPATLGTALAAPERRHLLFIGDGSFQLTAQELSTLLRLELKPVIFLLNNRGYTIERFILGMKDAYNDVANWKYSALPSVFAEHDRFTIAHAGTEAELEAVLEQVSGRNELCFVELALDAFDAPEGLKKFGPLTAEFDYGPRGPQRTAL